MRRRNIIFILWSFSFVKISITNKVMIQTDFTMILLTDGESSVSGERERECLGVNGGENMKRVTKAFGGMLLPEGTTWTRFSPDRATRGKWFERKRIRCKVMGSHDFYGGRGRVKMWWVKSSHHHHHHIIIFILSHNKVLDPIRQIMLGLMMGEDD